MSELTAQDKDKQQLETVTEDEKRALNAPTPDNFRIWNQWDQKIPVLDIAKAENMSVDAVYYHIKRVNNYLRQYASNRALNRARSKYDKVINGWESLVDGKHPGVIMQTMKSDIFPQKQGSNTAIRLNVNNIVDSMQAGAYDTNVEVVEDE